MSTHGVSVFHIQEIKPHPNADSLGIIDANGWDVIIKLGDFNVGDLVIHVEPDYVVPDTELFAWLKSDSKNWNRVRTRKFRGRYSHGIMVPAPEGLNEDDNAMETLGIVRYEPPLPLSAGGDNERAPKGFYPKYDVENYQRYKAAFTAGEEVIATEKIHGCFRADTPVMLANGEYRAISELQAGDMVMSYDGVKFVTDEVVRVINQELDVKWVKLTFDNEKDVICTEDHEFLTKNGWIKAAELTERDELVSIHFSPEAL